MTQFNRLAKFGAAIVAALAVAVTLLVGLPGVAHAAAVSVVTPAAPIQAPGLTETWTVGYVPSATSGITTGAVTFPTGFTVPQGMISSATARGAGAACTNVVATGVGQVVSFTMASCATANEATNNFVIPGVVNTTTTGRTENFNVVTSADPAATGNGTAVIGVRAFAGGTIVPAGLTLVSFTGTVDLLDATGAANTPRIVTVTVTVNGKLMTHVIGAPAFVNANFRAAFLRGLDATLMIVKTGD